MRKNTKKCATFRRHAQLLVRGSHPSAFQGPPCGHTRPQGAVCMHCVDSLAFPPRKLLQGHAIHHLCHDTLLYFTQQTCFNVKILEKTPTPCVWRLMGDQRIGLCALFCAQAFRQIMHDWSWLTTCPWRSLATSNPKFILDHGVHAFDGGFPTLFVHMLGLAYHFSSNTPTLSPCWWWV